MKKAVASKKSHSIKAPSIKKAKQKQSAKVLKLKIPKRRQIGIKKTLLVGVFIALLIWSVYPLKQRAEQRRETGLLKAQVLALRTKNENLEEEVKRLNSDEYIEQIARRDFGLVKPGESSVLVVPEEEGQPQDIDPEAANQKEQQKEDNPKKKENAKPKKAASDSDKKKSSQDGNSNKSWWQKALSFLDVLTEQK